MIEINKQTDNTLFLNALKNLAAAAGFPMQIDTKGAIDDETASKIKQFEQFRDILTEYKFAIDDAVRILEDELNRETKHDSRWHLKRVKCYQLCVSRFKLATVIMSNEFFIDRYKGRQTTADKYTNAILDKVRKEYPELIKNTERLLQSEFPIQQKDKALLAGLLQRCYNGFGGNEQLETQTFHELLKKMQELSQGKVKPQNAIATELAEPKFKVEL